MAKTCRNPQAPLLFLALLLISSFCVLSLDFSIIFEEYEAFSAPKRSRALLQNPKEKQFSTMKIMHQDQTTSTASSATTSSNPAAAAATRKERQFQMAAHEVPSGPNPESNR